jgi:hypothetical protein
MTRFGRIVTVLVVAVNLFADLNIDLLQLLPSDVADEPIVFEARGSVERGGLTVEFTHGFDKIVISHRETGDRVELANASAASPGWRGRLSGDDVHVQLLRANNEVCRGPLLVFRKGTALPFFVPQRGLRRVFRGRARGAVLPVSIMSSADPERREHEIRFGLNVCARLLSGPLAAGEPDDSYSAA